MTPLKTSPKLFDAVIQEMQLQLAGGLPWLQNVYGKAERTHREYHGERYYMPSVYVGGGKYEPLMPDVLMGNYAFFYMEDPQDISDQLRVMPYFGMAGDVNLVVWGDSRTIEAEDDRNIESIKSAILQVLGGMQLQSGNVKWDRIWEQSRGVMSEYSITEDDGEFMMWPYFAFRFRGRLTCNSGCEL